MKQIIGREPAVFFGLIAGLVLAVIQLVNVTDPLAGALNAVVLAAAGLATAAVVDVDKVLPALVGLITATFAVFLAYGSPVPESTQTGILALVTAAAAFFVRQNVVAPVTITGSPARELALKEARRAGYLFGIEEEADSAYDRGLRDGANDPSSVLNSVPADDDVPVAEHSDGPDFPSRLA